MSFIHISYARRCERYSINISFKLRYILPKNLTFILKASSAFPEEEAKIMSPVARKSETQEGDGLVPQLAFASFKRSSPTSSEKKGRKLGCEKSLKVIPLS